MPHKQLPQELHGVWNLIGEHDTARFQRISDACASAEAAGAAFRRELESVFPKTSEETALWTRLTSPENREALLSYISSCGENIGDDARRLFNALVAESDRRAGTRL